MKYAFTDMEKEVDGRTLRRIYYVKGNFEHNILPGSMGGWLESEENLSQDDRAYVLDEAMVMGEAVVEEFAIVKGNVLVKDKAIISGHSVVGGNAIVKDEAHVKHLERPEEGEHVSGWVVISGKAMVCGRSVVLGKTKMPKGSSRIAKNQPTLLIDGETKILDRVLIQGVGMVHDSIVYTNAQIFGTESKPFVIKKNCNIGQSCKLESVRAHASTIAHSHVVESVLHHSTIALSENNILRKSTVRDSLIKDEAFVADSTITDSVVKDRAKVVASTLSYVKMTDDSRVQYSTLKGKVIRIKENASLKYVKMKDVKIGEISGSAIVNTVDFDNIDNLTIRDEVEVRGFTHPRFDGSSVRFIDSGEIFLVNEAQIINKKPAQLTVNLKMIKLKDSTRIMGAFEFTKTLCLSEFSSLENHRDWVVCLKELDLKGDEQVVYNV